jgi:NAD(P)-dependent dehydrogenase (short-subunit alcohol dehydrogenase family)
VRLTCTRSTLALLSGTGGQPGSVRWHVFAAGLMVRSVIDLDGLAVQTGGGSLHHPCSTGAGTSTTVEQTKASIAARIPLKRYGAPEEVRRLMLFLASDESSFCTGGVYMVDGGSSAGG